MAYKVEDLNFYQVWRPTLMEIFTKTLFVNTTLQRVIKLQGLTTENAILCNEKLYLVKYEPFNEHTCFSVCCVCLQYTINPANWLYKHIYKSQCHRHFIIELRSSFNGDGRWPFLFSEFVGRLKARLTNVLFHSKTSHAMFWTHHWLNVGDIPQATRLNGLVIFNIWLNHSE